MIQDLAEVHSLLSNVRDTIYTSWGFFCTGTFERSASGKSKLFFSEQTIFVII